MIEPFQVINLSPKACNESSGANGGDDQQFSKQGQGGRNDYCANITTHVWGEWTVVEHTAVV